jgi:23S rRNA (cytidine1920-2'-O)/16S rRNA (cytidine1409-2'-O)-methyltransferase
MRRALSGRSVFLSVRASRADPAEPTQPAEPGRRPAASQRKPTRQRLDLLLTQRGLAPSRERARALIMAGEALVDGRAVTKAGELVSATAEVTLATPPAELRYVSRGGLKLERALDTFALSPAGRVCLDVGASTGGFTDLLLRRGATRVYAVDVGHGQLAWSLRTDPRVVVMERVNIRHLTALPEPAECVVIDVSFISLRLVLPRVAALLAPDGWVVALVKPQFEAGRAEADRGRGVISDPAAHRRVLRELLAWLADWPARHAAEANEAGGGFEAATPLAPLGLIVSPIAGRDGNHEYLLWLAPATAGAPHAGQALRGEAAERAIERVVAEALTPDEPPAN